MQEVKNSKNLFLSAAIVFNSVAIFICLYFTFLNQKNSEAFFRDINNIKLENAITKNDIAMISKIEKIEQDSYKKIVDISIENLRSKIDTVENIVAKSNIKSDSKIERRLIICLSILIKLEREGLKGNDVSKLVNELNDISMFDPVLQSIIKPLKTISKIKTHNQIVDQYITIVRRISSAYYRSKNRYIVAFFARHFYTTKTNGRFYKIGDLITNGNFELAARELKFATQDIDSEDAQNYIKDLQDYVLFNNQIDTVHSYIISYFGH